MPELTYNKEQTLSSQAELTLDGLLETMPSRQRNLIGIVVNTAIHTTVENMIHAGEEDFQLMQKRGLIRKGVTEVEFNKVKSSTPNLNSEHDIKQRANAYINSGIVKQSNDLASVGDLTEYQKQRDDYVAAMDQYQAEQTIYQQNLLKVLAQAQTDSDNTTSFRDGNSSHVSLVTEQSISKRPSFPTDEKGNPLAKPTGPRVRKSNLISDVTIIDSGYKSPKRTKEKIKQELGGNVSKLTDSSRVTIMASSPEIEERFVKNLLHELSKKGEGYPVYDSTTEVHDSGYISRKLLVPLSGAISEVKLLEPEIQQAEVVTHLAYTPARRMIGEDGLFAGDKINDTAREQINIEYNTIMTEVKKNQAITVKLFTQGEYKDFSFEEKSDDTSFKGDELKERYKELERLRQALHTSAALFTVPSFKEKYFGRIKAINRDRGSDVFPKELIPPKEIIETSDIVKIEEYIESGFNTESSASSLVDEVNTAKSKGGGHERS